MNNIIDFGKLGVLLHFDKADPLVFQSSLFLFCFILLLIVNRFTAKNKVLRVSVLLLFSVFFYYKLSGMLVLLLLASAVFNYSAAIGMEKAKGILKNILFYFAVIANLFLLGYFKYTNFFIDIVNSALHKSISPMEILIPLGISFYTFKAISYLIEVKWESMSAERNILDFLLYYMFFANISMGPIDRAYLFIPQIKEKFVLDKKQISIAVYLIILGLIKKVVIADYIGLNFVDRVFETPVRFTGIENLLASYAYSLQLYCDFSGYTDMALGIASLLGFNLMANFNNPYKAKSIAEFWRRWHISLSSWLQDYLFKPMQLGMRSLGTLSNVIAIFITFTICGIWHGAGINFVLWGALHGILLIIGMLTAKPKDKLYTKLRIKNSVILNIWKTFFTFNLITGAWILFRAPDLEIAKQVYIQIFSFLHIEVLPQFIKGFPAIAALIAAGYLFHFLPEKFENKVKDIFIKTPLPVKALVLALVIYITAQAKFADLQPFLYFQF